MAAITLQHSRILTFFQAHPKLDPEETVCKFIDIMENLHESMSNTMGNTAVLDMLQSLNHKMDNVSQANTNLEQQLAARMNDLRKEYVDDLKMVLTCNVSDKIEPLLREQNAVLFDKTNAVIASLIPQNESAVVGRIESVVKTFQDHVTADTRQLLSSTMDAATLQRHLAEFDEKIHRTVASSQSILNQSIENTERRLDGRMDAITTTSNQVSEALHTSVSSLLHKFENSSSKGQLSENLLFSVLGELYPTAAIEQVGQTKETGDIMLRRPDRPTVLVENKDWSRPVPQTEVSKFMRDIDVQHCSGIFLSQNGAITSRENFQIDLYNGHVLVYVHDVRNDPERIKMAIDIVDRIEPALSEITSMNEQGTEETISKELVKQLNVEMMAFIEHKLAIVNSAKTFQKTLLKQLDDMRMPSLEEYLGAKFSTGNTVYKCEYCEYTHPTKQGRGAHMRGCPERKKHVTEKQSTEKQSTEKQSVEITVS